MIPGDIEIDLYRISNGEPIRWKGMSSGATEKLQGYALLGAGGVMAVIWGFGGVATIGDALTDFERSLNNPDDLGPALFGLVGLIAAATIAWLGWRMVQSAGRVAWAVTTKRLIRMIGGEADRARSWTKADILKVERMKWGAQQTEGLAVTARSRMRRGRRRTRVLMIIGPADLDMAERALREMDG